MSARPYFRLDEPTPVVEFLQSKGWLQADESVLEIARAGEGNMNLVLRIRTDRRSMILKQSRPWVEKYPQISAPENRIVGEVTFYRVIQGIGDLADTMPRLLAFDENARAALLEDLGDVRDYTRMYDGERPPCDELRPMLRWLGLLHRTAFPQSLRPFMANRAMRALNHRHLFDFPLQPNNGWALDGFTPGLQALADRLKENPAYIEAIQTLGERYLADGDRLLHGDFYPGSWVQTPAGPRVIDPEFAFFGPAEYDVGVCLAHLTMAGYEESERAALFMSYTPTPGFDRALVSRFAGMEIMRRLIGVAQLPLTRSIDQKHALLDLSERLVLDPDSIFLF
jgi:5-methylthioribose kinase